jgi:hypothetical protein
MNKIELKDIILQELSSIIDEKKKKKKKKQQKGKKRARKTAKRDKKKSKKKSGLHAWFNQSKSKDGKAGWVDVVDGDACAREEGETAAPKCVSSAKRASMTKAERESAQRRKREKDRKQPQKKGAAKPTYVKTDKNEGLNMDRQRLMEIINEELEEAYNAMMAEDETFYEVDALDENEEYCPNCAQMEEAKKKKPCKPPKGKRFSKRVNGKCVPHGQAGKAKDGGDRIRPGTEKAHAYCARSFGIKKCKNPPCANALSRKKWKCQGKRSVTE